MKEVLEFLLSLFERSSPEAGHPDWQPVLDSLLSEPDKWTIDKYYARHSSKKVEIWVASGSEYVNVNGTKPDYKTRAAIMRAIEQIRVRKITEALI